MTSAGTITETTLLAAADAGMHARRPAEPGGCVLVAVQFW